MWCQTTLVHIYTFFCFLASSDCSWRAVETMILPWSNVLYKVITIAAHAAFKAFIEPLGCDKFSSQAEGFASEPSVSAQEATCHGDILVTKFHPSGDFAGCGSCPGTGELVVPAACCKRLQWTSGLPPRMPCPRNWSCHECYLQSIRKILI